MKVYNSKLNLAMKHRIPTTTEEVLSLRQAENVDAELMAAAIFGVVRLARSQGHSLEELTAEVLREDGCLDAVERSWLSTVMAKTWQDLED